MKPVHVIGVPLDLGAGHRGVDMGPSALRIAGLDAALADLGRVVVDKGNLSVPIPETEGEGDRSKKYIGQIADVCSRLYDTSLASFEQGALPLVLGGDHSLAAGSVAAASVAAARGGGHIGLLWVDAHGDMNSPTTSTSGNVHGMPLSALLGDEPAELANIAGMRPKVSPAHTVLIGIRNLDEREKEILRASGVRVYTMKDIDRVGIAPIVEAALLIVGTGTTGVHLSFDLDACDPSIAPGVGTPVKGGLDYREAHVLMELVADSGMLTSMDLVEANPIFDVRNVTAELGVELVLSALGKNIL
jgi:arginase